MLKHLLLSEVHNLC